MTKVAVKAHASGAGSVTLEAPDTATHQVLTLPDKTAKLGTEGPAFSAYKSADQSLTSGVAAKVTFDTEDFDTAGAFSASRFQPAVAGYYRVSAHVACAVVSGFGAAYASLYKNGAEYERGSQLNASNVTIFSSTASTLVYLNGTTDYLEVYALTSGTTPSIAGTVQRITKLAANFVRGA